jgi:CheY-like chemotaxis protein
MEILDLPARLSKELGFQRQEVGMERDTTPLQKAQLSMLGAAYGGPRFWYEILREDARPENIWRSLLFLGSTGTRGCEEPIRNRLHHPNSRVRGWACSALAEIGDEDARQGILALADDASPRVRRQARLAHLRLNRHGGREPASRPKADARESLVLVSDDSGRVQDQLASVLRPRGFQLAFASSDDETVEMALRLHPWAIMTDNQKGRDNMSGLRMTERIASTPALEGALLLMMTADPVEGGFLWAGGDAFFLKWHVGPPQLVAVLEDYLIL